MIEAIIVIVLIVVGFPLAVLAAYLVEERTDSPKGAPPSPIAD